MSKRKSGSHSAVSRRDALRAGMVGAGTWAIANSDLEPEASADDSPKAGYIDAHVHVWTPDTDGYPLAAGYSKEKMRPPSFTPEELFAHCRPCGVERIVLIQMSFYGFDNTYMLEAIEKHEGVFSGVALVDRDTEPAKTMLQLFKQGVRGVRVPMDGLPPEKWLQGEGMADMWKCGAEQGMAICPLIDPEYIPAVDRMCKKYPATPVVIDHFARIGADGEIREADVKALCGLAGHENVHVKVSAYYALGKKKAPYLDLGPMIGRLLEAYGPSRLMWASDCPFQVAGGHIYKDSIDLIRRHLDFLTPADRQWLLGKTAEGVFFC